MSTRLEHARPVAHSTLVVASVHHSERITSIVEELCKPGAMLFGMTVVVQQHPVVDAELGEGDLLNSVDRRGVLQVKADDRVGPLDQDTLQEVDTPRHFLAALRVHHFKLHILGWGNDDGVLPPLLRGVRH